MINKIHKNLKIGLAGILLTASLESCHVLENLHTFVVEEEYDSLTKEQIDKNFSFLNDGLREHFKEVYIINDPRHFGRGGTVAHTYKNGIVCLQKDYSDETIFHEAGHARHFALKRMNSNFSDEWKEISDFRHGKKNTKRVYMWGVLWDISWKGKPKSSGPKNGCLEPYAGENIYEDVATFIECLDYYQMDLKNIEYPAPSKYPLFFCNPNDERYQKKLNLLRKYNFLTEEEHNGLNEKLGALHYMPEK